MVYLLNISNISFLGDRLSEIVDYLNSLQDLSILSQQVLLCQTTTTKYS